MLKINKYSSLFNRIHIFILVASTLPKGGATSDGSFWAMPPQQSGWRRFHQVDALADADIHVVVDVGVVVVVDIDVDLPPLQSN